MTTATAAVAAEGALPPSTPDPQDECVICCYPFPLELGGSVYHECCGEVICTGCIIGERRTRIIGNNVKKPIKGSKGEELEFRKIMTSKQTMLCPFCRTKEPRNSKEYLKRLWDRIDEYNDPNAMIQLGVHYMKGDSGLSKNLKKAEELLQRSYDLGNPNAAYNLSVLHRDHVPDEARMIQYAEEAARRGDLNCMNVLAHHAAQSGNQEEAKRYLMTAARSGDEFAMQNLMEFYRNILLSKEDLATTLRAHKAANDNAKSEAREYANRYNKKFREKKNDSQKN